MIDFKMNIYQTFKLIGFDNDFVCDEFDTVCIDVHQHLLPMRLSDYYETYQPVDSPLLTSFADVALSVLLLRIFYFTS